MDENTEPTVIEPIVSAEWLERHLGQVTVCDVRTSMAADDPRRAFEAGHLPGARFVDLDSVLADPPAGVGGRHPLPAPDRFADGLASLGIGADTTVVAYDDRGGAFAARLVWMLRVIGQDAALLDGGLAGWPGPLETGGGEPQRVERSPMPWPRAALADADEVAAHVAAGGVVVDSREGPRYRGEVEPIDAVAGHVPGAVNLPVRRESLRRPVPPPGRPGGALRRRGPRPSGDRLLRVRGDRLPQRVGDGARRTPPPPCLRRLVVRLVERSRATGRRPEVSGMDPIRLGVLCMDDMPASARPVLGDYPALYAHLLRAEPVETTCFAVHRGELPASVDECRRLGARREPAIGLRRPRLDPATARSSSGPLSPRSGPSSGSASAIRWSRRHWAARSSVRRRDGASAHWSMASSTRSRGTRRTG